MQPLDPDACLTEIRKILEGRDPYCSRLEGRASDRLAELVEALDKSIMGGGLLPKEWEPSRIVD